MTMYPVLNTPGGGGGLAAPFIAEATSKQGQRMNKARCIIHRVSNARVLTSLSKRLSDKKGRVKLTLTTSCTTL
jgi:hypothetical protein